MPFGWQRPPGVHAVPAQTQFPPAAHVPGVPALHVAFPAQRHAPAPHLNPGGQLCPQAPQLPGSDWRSLQPVEQHACVPVQATPPLHWHMPIVLQVSPYVQVVLPLMSPQRHRPPPTQLTVKPPPLAPHSEDLLHEQRSPEHVRPCAQLLPQPPQLEEFVAASSQPLSFVGAFGCEQFAQPIWQVESQSPPLQDRLSTWAAEQARPQAPQLPTSFRMSTHALPHNVNAVFEQTHFPDWQVEPPGHVLPQAPQLLGSTFRSVQKPLQSVAPVGHLQLPEVHCVPPLQAMLHPPQLALSELSSTH